jgi:hypothetical protein
MIYLFPFRIVWPRVVALGGLVELTKRLKHIHVAYFPTP